MKTSQRQDAPIQESTWVVERSKTGTNTASPIVSVSCVANVFVRQMFFQNAGDVEHGHRHTFDHQTLLAHGSLKVVVDGEESVFVAPQIIFIRADKQHELTALEPGTVAFCIHAVRNGDGVNDIIDPAGLPLGVESLRLVGAKPFAIKSTKPVA